MKKNALISLLIAGLAAGCVTLEPLTWNDSFNETAETEYEPYLVKGKNTLTGQAFLTQRGGGVVKAAGREVTLDPATSIGQVWWQKAGRIWSYRKVEPPSPGFQQARRVTTADADGRFTFRDIPAGKYFVRTEVTWIVGSGYDSLQGGLVGKQVEVKDGEMTEIILNRLD